MGPAPKPDTPPRMTREEFRRWAEEQEGKWELVDGHPVAQAAQRAAHARMCSAIHFAFRDLLRTRGTACEAFSNSITVEVAERSEFIPDVLIECGAPLGPDATTAMNPVVVVEVISPSTTRIDFNLKMDGYFQVPSIQHYLIVYARERRLLHYRRQADGTILTTIMSGGSLDLSPPGIVLDIDALYAEVGA